MSRKIYTVPAPKSAKYTTTKASSELATAAAAIGEAESAVRNRL
jgi:hypothetical protein